MSALAFIIVVFILYPFIKYTLNRWNDAGEQALRERGFIVPRQRRHVGQGVPRTKQPPHGLGMRGPIEGRFWGQFRP